MFNRGGTQPVMVFDRDGSFAQMWGAGQFVRPHGIFIGPDDRVYLTDDKDHTVRKFTPDGQLLMTLGTSGEASDTGVEGSNYRTIRRPGSPFNLPTNLALLRLFVFVAIHQHLSATEPIRKCAVVSDAISRLGSITL